MPSRFLSAATLSTSRAPWFGFTFLACLLCIFLTPFSLSGEEAEKSTGQQDSKTRDRVYVVNGATITWDLERKEYRQPSEAQAAQLARQFSELMAAKAGQDGKTPTSLADVKVETLPNGMKKALLPVSLMNVAAVQVSSEGHLEDICTEAHETPALNVAQSSTALEEEQR